MSLSDRLRRVDGPRLDLLVAAAILLELEFEALLDQGIPDSRRAVSALAAVLFVAALAVQAAAEREQRKRAAISHERLRIGGELQDIVAHSVSAMVIQAGAARQRLYDDPQRARNSILVVERTGREALADLRRLLGML